MSIDLQQFCSRDSFRPYLMAPFSIDGFTWATNGHILVRVPMLADVPAVKDAPKPKRAKRAMQCHENATFAPLPNVKWPPDLAKVTCEVCGGSKVDPDCETEPCFECEGEGFHAPETVSVAVRGAIFNSKYVRMAMALPDAEFSTEPCAAKARGTTEPTAFRFLGGLGALMPMSRVGKIHLGDIEDLPRAL